jgi:hypothetical protein
VNVEARRSRVRTVSLVTVVGLVLLALSCKKEGIPEPPASLTDASPAIEFLRYGDSLRFATDTPGVLTLVRPAAGGLTSTLRIRSELRLPNTSHSHYERGRIIEKFETSGAQSTFQTPIGVAYLWVKATSDTSFTGTLYYRNYVTGEVGQTPVFQRHSAPRPFSFFTKIAMFFGHAIPDCDELPGGAGDVECCMCGGGRLNCSSTVPVTAIQLEELLRNTPLPAPPGPGPVGRP